MSKEPLAFWNVDFEDTQAYPAWMLSGLAEVVEWSGLLKGLYSDWKSLPYMLRIPFSRQPLLMQVFVLALSVHQYDCQLTAGFDCRHLLSVPYFHVVKEVLRPSVIPPLYNWFVGWLYGVIVPLENFSIIWRRHHCRWRVANFDLCSALMAIEQWGFFNVPHPLRHGPTVYNVHLRGPVTLTPNAERLAVELSLPVLTT